MDDYGIRMPHDGDVIPIRTGRGPLDPLRWRIVDADLLPITFSCRLVPCRTILRTGPIGGGSSAFLDFFGFSLEIAQQSTRRYQAVVGAQGRRQGAGDRGCICCRIPGL